MMMANLLNTKILYRRLAYNVGMSWIFQNSSQFWNFQTLISLLSYFLRPYNWLSWLLLHWAMLLVPSKCSKQLPKSCSIISQKARFDWFSWFFFFFHLSSSGQAIPLLSEPLDSWVSFFTVIQCLGQGCATTGSKDIFLLIKFMVFMWCT